MVSNIVHATYAETYDLNTAVGELSVLGIHTPRSGSLKKIFHGFFEQYKKFRILGCNLKMVCASQQSLDPSQMGLEAGQVDPRDILNPILFKACTGEGMADILDMAYNISSSGSLTQNNIPTGSGTAIDAYYSFLADTAWRKSHPQAGLEISHLKPMVHKVVTTQPFKWTGKDDTRASELTDSSYPMIKGNAGGNPATANDVYGFGSVSEGVVGGAYGQFNVPTCFVSNGVTEMPWLDTAYNDAQSGPSEYVLMSNVPRVYMGCIILPPAILQRLFFRMTIVWHIEFKDFRPSIYLGSAGVEYEDATGGETSGGLYFNIYHNATPTKLLNEQSSFTTTAETEVTQIMEKGL